MNRKSYPSDISDDEWACVDPYLTLMTEEAPQREHSLREVFNGLRWIVRSGAAWRMMPHDLPPWYTVYQQSQRWFKAGVFETVAVDLGEVLRLAQGRKPQPSADSVETGLCRPSLHRRASGSRCRGQAPATRSREAP